MPSKASQNSSRKGKSLPEQARELIETLAEKTGLNANTEDVPETRAKTSSRKKPAKVSRPAAKSAAKKAPAVKKPATKKPAAKKSGASRPAARKASKAASARKSSARSGGKKGAARKKSA